MQNPMASTDVRLMNSELMRGKYTFEFPEQANTIRKKINRVSVEPLAFQLYKRGDYSSKIDAIPVKKMRMAQLLYSLVKSAKRDRAFSAEALATLKADDVMLLAKEAAKKWKAEAVAPGSRNEKTERSIDDGVKVPILERREASQERSERSWKNLLPGPRPKADAETTEPLV